MRAGVSFARARAAAIRCARPAECALPPSPVVTCGRRRGRWGRRSAAAVPPQRGHVRLNFIAPAIWVTLPVPLHCGQPSRRRAGRPGAVAGVARLLARDVQLHLRALIACQKSMFMPYSRSAPFSGCASLRASPAAEELAEDVAESAAASVRRPSARPPPVRAAALLRSTRRNRIRRNPCSDAGPAPPGARRPAESVLRIEAVLVVHLPLLRVAQDVVGFLTFLKRSSAALSPGFRSGWYLRASFR